MSKSIYFVFLLVISLAFSFGWEGKKIENKVSTEVNEIEPEDTILVVSQDRNEVLYQKEKQALEVLHSIRLPETIDLKKLYEEVGSTIEYGAFVRYYKDYFLTLFNSGTDVENSYYATFDMDGNLVDVLNIGTRTFGVDFTTEFVHNDLIKVLHFHEEGFEIEENGNSTDNKIDVTGEYVYLKKNGLLKLINVKSSKTANNETATGVLNYYTTKIKKQRPTTHYKLFSFGNIPGNNAVSTEDVYESLEGGNMYSLCLEIRDSIHDLVGIIGYKNKTHPDSSFLTFSFALNKNPILYYSIVSINGRMYLEIIRLLPQSKEDAVQIIKEYYAYPQNSKSIQTPIHTIKGSIKKLLEKPLGKEDRDKLK